MNTEIKGKAKNPDQYRSTENIEKRSAESIANYELAQSRRYGDKDLLGALKLYSQIIATQPDTSEANHSRSQINNIVTKVVPADELLNLQMDLAVKHLKEDSMV